MKSVAVRGAITAQNTKESIVSQTRRLLEAVLKANHIEIDEIIQIIFTCTKDLNAAYPAIAARALGITEAALMCMQEMDVEGSLEHCIRLSMLCTSGKETQHTVKHQYLGEARKLRPDLAHFSLALDGPAGAGKSTIAKRVAAELGCTYIDTGAMYRSVGLYCIQRGIDYNFEDLVNEVLEDMHIDLTYENATQCIYLNSDDVSEAIRTQEVAASASKVATYAKVRTALVDMQRRLAATKSVVMDGRDIGTVVLPKATLKIFLTASSEERAKRRFKEYEEKGLKISFETLLEEIEARDYQDMNRSVSPLKKAEDAVEVDTTNLSVEQIVTHIIELLKERQ
ncbi:MAG: (d)CMP kinase [Niameybacter sp.]|uniref:(d)CMP kinase n=1 Tax=Niameybacter sp. TaxID=2033640 RepID=UPI002FC5BEAA